MTAPGVLLVYCAKDAADFRLGGLENAVFAQVAGLVACGVPVTLWTSSKACAELAERLGGRALYDPLIHDGIRPLLSLRLWRAARALRREGVAAAIHHSGRTWAWGHLFFPTIPHAHVLHRHRLGSYRFFRNWLSLSHRRTEEMRQAHGMGGWRRVETVPNGLRLDMEVAEEPPTDLKPEGEPFRVVALGRVGFRKGVFHSKGFDLLVDAIALLKERGAQVELVIGGGSDPGLEAYAAEKDVADRVTLAGYIRDVAGFLRGGDVFCLPSRIEPFGLVVIEAMAQARAVIATDTHGPADIVVDGETGLIVPVDDAEALASAILRLQDDPQARRAMGRAGHARVRSVYSARAVGDALTGALRKFGARL